MGDSGFKQDSGTYISETEINKALEQFTTTIDSIKTTIESSLKALIQLGDYKQIITLVITVLIIITLVGIILYSLFTFVNGTNHTPYMFIMLITIVGGILVKFIIKDKDKCNQFKEFIKNASDTNHFTLQSIGIIFIILSIGSIILTNLMLKDNCHDKKDSCGDEKIYNEKIYGFTAVIISAIYIIYFSIVNAVTKWGYITLAFLIQVFSVISYFDSNAKVPAAYILTIIAVMVIINNCLLILPGINKLKDFQNGFGIVIRFIIIVTGGKKDFIDKEFECKGQTIEDAIKEITMK